MTATTHCTQCGNPWDYHDGIVVTCSNLQMEREKNRILKEQNAELLEALKQVRDWAEDIRTNGPRETNVDFMLIAAVVHARELVDSAIRRAEENQKLLKK